MIGRINEMSKQLYCGTIIGEDDRWYYFNQDYLVNPSDWQECEIGRRVTFDPAICTHHQRAALNIMVL